MWRNNLTIALRALKRRPGPAIINILGLAVGLAACLLIALWVNHQFSYDDFHPEADRIHRIALDVKLQDREITGPITAAPLAHTLIEDIPEVETATRFGDREDDVFRVDDRTFTGLTTFVADSLFFDVFGGFRFLHGNRATALQPTDAIVLTASTAQRLFGTTNAVGETLQRDNTTRRVTGVVANVPPTSHMHFDAVASDELSPEQASRWVGNNWYTYAKLTPGASPEAFETKVGAFVQEYVAPQIQQFLGMPFNQLVEQGARYQYFTQPLTSIHLHSNYQYELEANGSIAYVYTFSAIALFILLIACVNFMNLATARASERATEVGMRKALGAYRSQLAGQFLGEAVLTTTLATALALGLALLALPAFNTLAGTAISPSRALQPSILLGGLGLVAVVGLVAGSYPAFVLSHFQPATVLKSDDRHSTSGHGKRLRQGLVVLQFAISITLIIGTLVVQQQFSYIQDKRLGIDKEQVATIDRAWTLGDGQAAFVDRVAQLPGVTAAGSGDGIFRGGMSNTVFIPDNAPTSASHSLNFLNVGIGFVETMGIEVLEGRTFAPGRPADSSAVLINRAAAEALGWESPTEHQLREPIGENETEAYDVIGVVDNFHYESMRQQVQPLVLQLDDVNSALYVRTASGGTAAALEAVRAAWSDTAPDDPFQYTFLDQTYGELHRDTQRTGQLFTVFAVLAIVIACLGLYGLATYTAQRRTKEIGIRKALGATGVQIVGLLSKEFLQLVGVAFVVALPVAYLGMDRWLQDFAYRTDLGVWLFGLAGALATLIAFLTVSYQAIRAAQTNPANTLHGN
jgi:putative ABC transport system permease protein